MTAPSEPDPDIFVAARGISIAYGDELILDGVDLHLDVPGELAVSGRSGSGKTSLLLALAGLIPPTAGTMDWQGFDPDPLVRRTQIAVVFQAPSLIPELTATENICLPLRLRGSAVDASVRAAAEALEMVGLDPAHGRVVPSELSGGEQQRVSVARAIATRPRLLLADEPSGALDRTNAATVIGALRESARRDQSSLVVATHDEDVSGMFVTQIVVEDGKLRWLRP
jgi:ABC-type lipoprotein export system ATPase subunit